MHKRMGCTLLAAVLCCLLTACGGPPQDTPEPSAVPTESTTPMPTPTSIPMPTPTSTPTPTPTPTPEWGDLYKYWDGWAQATRYDLTAEGLDTLWTLYCALPLTEPAERPKKDGNLYAAEFYLPGDRATVWFYTEDRIWIEDADGARGYACPAGSVDYDLLEQIYASQPTISKSQADVDSAIAAAWEIFNNIEGSELLQVWYDEASSTAAIRERLSPRLHRPSDLQAENLIAVGLDWIYYGSEYKSGTLLLKRSGPDEPWEYCDRDKAPVYARPTT